MATAITETLTNKLVKIQIEKVGKIVFILIDIFVPHPTDQIGKKVQNAIAAKIHSGPFFHPRKLIKKW